MQACNVETTPLGLPAVKSGGFALIYHLYQKEHWAVRCFYREIGDLKYRYDAISRFLEKNANGTFVKASLDPEGIRVGGHDYPVLVMPWVTGDDLNVYIERNIAKPNLIAWLADAFPKMVGQLEQLGVAHGDLQHGNIMVRNNVLTLIDYDGMYLPELSKTPAKVLGHLNYIHPDRPNVSPSVKIDRFPSIVIYLGLRAVAAQPSLWRKYSDGENILFKRNDFLDPLSSPLINDLKKIPGLRALAEKFQAICFLDFDKIPSLSEFTSSGYVPPPPPKAVAKPRRPTRAAKPVEYITQYEVILAENTRALKARVGHRLEVVGQITDYKKGFTSRKQPYMFLNFGDWRKKAFCLVMWADDLDMMQAAGIRPQSFVGKWVSVTGMISEYNGRPQLLVEIPSQIQVLPNEQEAFRRAKSHKKPSRTPQPSTWITIVPSAPKPFPRRVQVPSPNDVMSRQQADTLQKLYAGTPSIPPSTPTPVPRYPFASPKLAFGGILLTLVAIGFLIAANPFGILLLVIGLALTYLGALYRYDLEHITVQWLPSQPSYDGQCAGCGGSYGPHFYSSNPGLQVVQTPRGYMHHNCAMKAKPRRIWKKVNQIRLSKLWPVAHPVAVSTSKKMLANLFSAGLVCVFLISVFVMSYPSITWTSTTVQTSVSLSTRTEFTTNVRQSITYSTTLSTSSQTTCIYRNDQEQCRTHVSTYTAGSTSTATLSVTQTLSTAVQTFRAFYTKSFSSLVAPYRNMGISLTSWSMGVVVLMIAVAVAIVLVRRVI